MCTIGSAIQGIIGAASTVIPTVVKYNNQKDTLNYRTSLALNNMKDAKNQAYAQRQLGIEEARKQKISGLKQANQLMAQNAASGFSISSGNNLYNFEDTIDSAYSNAFDIQNSYNTEAKSYMKSAKSYLNEAKGYQNQKKSLGWNIAQTMLGTTKQVAGKWFP